MLFGRLGHRGLMSAGLAVGIAAGGAGGFGAPVSRAASVVVPVIAQDGAVVLVQSSPQPAPCGTSSTPPCKAQAQPKPKDQKQRRMTTCGPGLAPCPGSK